MVPAAWKSGHVKLLPTIRSFKKAFLIVSGCCRNSWINGIGNSSSSQQPQHSTRALEAESLPWEKDSNGACEAFVEAVDNSYLAYYENSLTAEHQL